MEWKETELKVIARIRTGFPEKFGIPRQSGLVQTPGKIVFEPSFQNPEMLRGVEEYSHLWLIWGFSGTEAKGWHPTVRPPRLGGNKRMGVFATRSPFRPNAIGLSCVRLEGVETDGAEGPVLWVTGADMMDGTPIYDIKPYLPYVDSIPQARGGFGARVKEYALKVEIPGKWQERIPEAERDLLQEILSQDPRPSYQEDPERIYGMEYAGMEVKFQVRDGCLTVCQILDVSGREFSGKEKKRQEEQRDGV